MAADLILEVATIPTPLGPLTVVATPRGVVATSSGEPDEVTHEAAVALDAAVGPAGRRVAAAGRELERYFAGRLRRFRTPVDLGLVGSPFGRSVLEVVRSIPYGKLWTYGDVAGLAGRPGAARAAGTWLRRSPIELFVPCHRVVPSGPGLGRYGDDDRRAFLLRLERTI